jgi:hypothetical protein
MPWLIGTAQMAPVLRHDVGERGVGAPAVHKELQLSPASASCGDVD